MAMLEPQQLVESRLPVEPAQDREQHEREHEAHREQARDMTLGEVAQLVGEHRLDFRRREPLDQRVEEDDALVHAETGEVRVAVARAARAIHDEKTRSAEATALDERLDALA